MAEADHINHRRRMALAVLNGDEQAVQANLLRLHQQAAEVGDEGLAARYRRLMSDVIEPIGDVDQAPSHEIIVT